MPVLFIYLLSSSLYSQNVYDQLIHSRKKVHVEKDSTMISFVKNDIDLTFLCHNLHENYRDLFFYYIYSVFRSKKENLKNTYYLKQWNTPIVIYFDKKISTSIIENFQSYFNQITGVKNLTITYTNDLKKANYFIKIIEEEPTRFKKSEKFKSKEIYDKYALTNVTYNILTDGNNKFYAGILSVNNQELRNEALALTKLKQVFFLTLGNFNLLPIKFKDDTLLSSKHVHSESFYDRDLEFLKIHYGTIYPQKINRTDFEKLKEKVNKSCNYD